VTAAVTVAGLQNTETRISALASGSLLGTLHTLLAALILGAGVPLAGLVDAVSRLGAQTLRHRQGTFAQVLWGHTDMHQASLIKWDWEALTRDATLFLGTATRRTTKGIDKVLHRFTWLAATRYRFTSRLADGTRTGFTASAEDSAALALFAMTLRQTWVALDTFRDTFTLLALIAASRRNLTSLAFLAVAAVLGFDIALRAFQAGLRFAFA